MLKLPLTVATVISVLIILAGEPANAQKASPNFHWPSPAGTSRTRLGGSAISCLSKRMVLRRMSRPMDGFRIR